MTRSAGDSAGIAQTKARIQAYFAALPPDARRHVRRIRELVRAAAPDAVESFSYGIPGFRLEGKPLVWYAAWKQHSSLYPIGVALARAHGIDLSRYETAKGTVRFPLAKPPPARIVQRLVKARVTEIRTSPGSGR